MTPPKHSALNTERPPTIDPQAAARWSHLRPALQGEASPWLHEEVARRMQERLQWLVLKPSRWVHWAPLRGGLQAHALVAKRYPQSECFLVDAQQQREQLAHKLIAKPWWNPARWWGSALRASTPAQPVQMVWANMALHMDADPQGLIAQWHSLLEADGFVMFSCLGPDTLRELRQVYAAQGWPVPSHEFTDMHDWGDMLVRAGFAEPVMDMERITLTFSTPQTLLAELRGLGRNLHPARFQGLRGRAWLAKLHAALGQELAQPAPSGPLHLSFEIIYGHAFKPQPRMAVLPQTTVSLEDMRHALRQSIPPKP